MMGHLQYIMMCMDRSFIKNVAIFHKKSPRIVGFDFNGDEPLQYDLPKYRVVIFLFVSFIIDFLVTLYNKVH